MTPDEAVATTCVRWNLEDEIDLLAARLAEAERDAARYRWLRDSQRLVHLIEPFATGYWPEVIDNEVDRRMQSETGELGNG